MKIESLELFGSPFDLVETYVYYEGPRTFALRSRPMPDLYYFVNTVDEDEDEGTVTMVAAAASGDRFRAVRSGLVPFREAFTEGSHNTVFSILWRWDTAANRMVQTVRSEVGPWLSDDWLPTPTATLRLPTETIEPYRPERLRELSFAQSRTIFAIEVEAEDATITEFPAKQAGELQIAVHKEIEALAKRYTSKSQVVGDIQPSIVELRAASFVLVMAIDSRRGMIEPTEITEQVFSEFHALLDAAANDDKSTLIAHLTESGSKVRNRFVDILTPLKAVGSGLTVWSSIAFTGEIEQASLTADQVRATAEAIEGVEPQKDEITVPRGTLIGLNIRLGRFELFDATHAVTYAGYMTESAASTANGLPVGDHSWVRALIRAEQQFAGEDDADRIKYWLEEIEPIKAGGAVDGFGIQ